MTYGGVGRAARAAWVIARAFSDNRVLAFVTFAAHAWALAVAGTKHVVLSDNGTGAAVVAPYKPGRSVARMVAVLLLLVTPTALASVVVIVAPTLTSAYLALLVSALTVLTLLWILLGTAVAVGRAGFPAAPVGPETPPGPRVVVSALAQLPGTHSDLMPSLRCRLRNLPSGTVVVTAAGSPELAERYERLGLIRGHQQRLHMVM